MRRWTFCCAVIIAAGVPQFASAEFMGQVRLETTNLAGEPINSVLVGSEFLLKGYVQDVRDHPPQFSGVFAAYTDVSFQMDLASALGPVSFDSSFDVVRIWSILPGQIKGVGASRSTGVPPGAAEQLLFSVPFQADNAGELTLSPQPDIAPGHDFLIYNVVDPIPPNEIRFVSAQLTIVPEPSSFASAALAAAALVVFRRKMTQRKARSLWRGPQ